MVDLLNFVMVIIGVYIIGVIYCNYISDRIYNLVDKIMFKDFFKLLQKLCLKVFFFIFFVMDCKSVYKFDIEYFRNIRVGYGLMIFD